MRLRAYIAASLDGYIAAPDGGVEWLEAVGAEDHGYDAFIGSIDAIVMGRTSYDQVLTFGVWPYEGKDVYVLTTRPFEPTTPRTTSAHAGPESLLESLRSMSLEGDMWLHGGPKSIDAFRKFGSIDTYDIYTIPVLLGDGIPLFARGERAEPLRLVHQRAFADGVVACVYEPS